MFEMLIFVNIIMRQAHCTIPAWCWEMKATENCYYGWRALRGMQWLATQGSVLHIPLPLGGDGVGGGGWGLVVSPTWILLEKLFCCHTDTTHYILHIPSISMTWKIKEQLQSTPWTTTYWGTSGRNSHIDVVRADHKIKKLKVCTTHRVLCCFFVCFSNIVWSFGSFFLNCPIFREWTRAMDDIPIL